MRTERLDSTSPELDAAEVEWWDRFSAVSDRVWSLDPELSAALRGRYFQRAATYLLQGASRNGAVLDLGCGSGVTSSFLAQRGVRVVGVDISESQIAAAREMARTHRSAASMEFRVADVSELDQSGERYDGVVAHAFLHHLAHDELSATLRTISGLLEPGGRAWFYEPVFPDPGRKGAVALAKVAERRAIGLVGRILDQLGMLDDEVVEELDAFENEARAHGYFLSPKEVPFTVAEFTRSIGGFFSIDACRWETTGSHQLAVLVALLRERRLRRLGLSAVRGLARLDDALGARGGLAAHRGLSGYGFAAAFARSRAA